MKLEPEKCEALKNSAYSGYMLKSATCPSSHAHASPPPTPCATRDARLCARAEHSRQLAPDIPAVGRARQPV